MSKRKRFTNGRLSVLTNTAFSALSGFAIIIVCILAFAFIITKIDVTDKVVSVLSSAALCAGAYAGGFISAKKTQKKRIVYGYTVRPVYVFYNTHRQYFFHSDYFRIFSVPETDSYTYFRRNRWNRRR